TALEPKYFWHRFTGTSKNWLDTGAERAFLDNSSKTTHVFLLLIIWTCADTLEAWHCETGLNQARAVVAACDAPHGPE
ncbi:MAG TPA: hypothetical protein VKU02_33690, partial [Gemmataceae bacterium]|nr:hypothetical protein [Gemmataceae bacterium]